MVLYARISESAVIDLLPGMTYDEAERFLRRHEGVLVEAAQQAAYEKIYALVKEGK